MKPDSGTEVQTAGRPWKQKVFPKKELPRLSQAGSEMKRVSAVAAANSARPCPDSGGANSDL